MTADAIAGSSLFSVGDFIDLPAFVKKLSTQEPSKDPISKYLWNQFPAWTRRVLTSTTSTPEEQKLALVQALNNILKGVLIYETVRFDKVKQLSLETQLLMSQNPKGNDLIRLNRLLLENAYPLEIAKSIPPVPLQLKSSWMVFDRQSGLPNPLYPELLLASELYEEVEKKEQARLVSLVRMEELFRPILYRESIDETWANDRQLKSFFGGDAPYLAITRNGEYVKLVPRLTILNSMVEKLVMLP
jgi:hypothetical protein